MQRRVLQELRTAPFDPGVWHLAQPGMQFLNQARFTEPRLADDEYQLPFALPRLLPAGDFFLTADYNPMRAVFEKIPTLNSPPLPPEMPANRGNLALGCLSRLAEMRENATNI